MSDSQYRVAVTGLGSISALGHTVPDIWEELKEGRSAIAEITRAPAEKLHVKIAAEIKNYDETAHFGEKDLPFYDRFTQFALIAAGQAIADSGVDFENAGLGAETATIVASGVGGWTTIDDSFMRMFETGVARAHPLTVPRMMISAAASQVTMKFGLTGPAFCVSSACSSANHAIGEAYWMVRSGRARAAVTGGSESSISMISQRSWESVRVLATDTCRPFSDKRRGMVIGEGAGILILERLEDAQARGAEIYAEMVGYGLSADAGDIVMPDQNGAARAIQQALDTGGLKLEDITYVNAHGTGTLMNDKIETGAIKQVFGDHAKELMVSSTKSLHGHALGAAGALEAVATLKAMKEGVVPPTANYLGPDPDCDLDYVPNEARDAEIKGALSNSLAFGGLNAVLAFRNPN